MSVRWWAIAAILPFLFPEQLPNGMSGQLYGFQMRLCQILDAQWVNFGIDKILTRFDRIFCIEPLGTPVCGLKDINCYTSAQDELYTLMQNQTMAKSIDESVDITCNCMPACTSLEYNFEISRAKYDVAKTIRAFREEYEHTEWVWQITNITVCLYIILYNSKPSFSAIGSRLSVYFKEHQFTAIKRTILFGVSTLISNCGGICGLFMGISCLSFLELIYFFCMRICGSCRDRRKHKIQQQNSVDLPEEKSEN